MALLVQDSSFDRSDWEKHEHISVQNIVGVQCFTMEEERLPRIHELYHGHGVGPISFGGQVRARMTYSETPWQV